MGKWQRSNSGRNGGEFPPSWCYAPPDEVSNKKGFMEATQLRKARVSDDPFFDELFREQGISRDELQEMRAIQEQEVEQEPYHGEAKNGDLWNGERVTEGQCVFYLYEDKDGNLYESSEVPVYKIHMDNARLVTCDDGKVAIAPK
jgi:hypothetical protein